MNRMGTKRNRALLTLCVVVISGASVATALAGSGNARRRAAQGVSARTRHVTVPNMHQSSRHVRVRMVTTVDPWLVRNVRIFRVGARNASARAAADGLPVSAFQATAAPLAGANVGLAQTVTVGGVPVMAVPGSNSLCLVAPGSFGCRPIAAVGTYDSYVVISNADNQAGTERVAGVAPDSVQSVVAKSADHGTTQLELVNGIFGGAVDGTVSELDFNTTEGRVAVPLHGTS